MLPPCFMDNDRVRYMVRIQGICIDFQPGEHDDQYTKAMGIPKLGKLGKNVT